MLFPTCDGGDIDSVVCQVGLDGIALFEDDGGACGSEMTTHRYEMDKISKWRLAVSFFSVSVWAISVLTSRVFIHRIPPFSP